jgi:hypothetical protein
MRKKVLVAARAKSRTSSATVALIALLAIATSAKDFSSWSPPVNLGPLVNSAFDDMHPAISPDGRSLYFSSNRPGVLAVSICG